jgi:hypothetical protein
MKKNRVRVTILCLLAFAGRRPVPSDGENTCAEPCDILYYHQISLEACYE